MFNSKDEFRFGKARILSFLVIDILCLVIANIISANLHLSISPEMNYSFEDQRPVMILMLIVDVLVSFVFNTLCRALRRNNNKELIEGARHIGISFVILAVILFTLRQGARFSRIAVYFAYAVYYVLFTLSHIAWKAILRKTYKRGQNETAILMTTDRFLEEGLDELKKLKIDVKYVYLLKNINKKDINGIPILKRWEEVGAAICWEMIDKVFVYGLDHQMVPEYLINACSEMDLKFDLVDFKYRVLDITSIQNQDPKYGTLSFLEGKRDIPFPIRRVYWITETEAELHRGFHAHKLNCQLLYCPYGVIDILLDDGQQKHTVTLDKPGKGLLLMPGMWREMIWRQKGSVLCVLASEYYDAKEYIRDYNEFIDYNKNYRDVNDPLKKMPH